MAGIGDPQRRPGGGDRCRLTPSGLASGPGVAIRGGGAIARAPARCQAGDRLVGGQVRQRRQLGYRQQIPPPEASRGQGAGGVAQPAAGVVVVLGVGGERGGQGVRPAPRDVARPAPLLAAVGVGGRVVATA